ncbi:guanylate kinase [Amorphus sp. 3PC139-8]|uniref:guanylate kinase n=1 Tax=Amorphus sp. 3PC139-8 TaxID=2735676 RepID=UPI00345C76DB
MLVLSSPSGAGKSTLSRLVLENDRNIELSISATTRAKRPSEVNGHHYHFVERAQFEAMRDHGDLLEWAEVHGNLYGTPRRPVETALQAGEDILFDIDWQGTLQLYEAARADVVSIFILPPSGAELRARLERRAEDDADTIAKRLANAKTELAHWHEYDYVIVNDDLDRAYSGVRAILNAERLKRSRLPQIEGFVEGLIQDL